MTAPRRRPDLNGRPYRTLRAAVLAASTGICHTCGKAIDLDLPGTHPNGPTLDHIIPVSRGGSPTDPRNLTIAHRLCNETRGSKLTTETRTPNQPSRDW